MNDNLSIKEIEEKRLDILLQHISNVQNNAKLLARNGLAAKRMT